MGSNENDILFGDFADKYLHTLTPEQVDRFETLIQEADTDLFNWVTGKEDCPTHFDHDVMAMIRKFVKNEAARV